MALPLIAPTCDCPVHRTIYSLGAIELGTSWLWLLARPAGAGSSDFVHQPEQHSTGQQHQAAQRPQLREGWRNHGTANEGGMTSNAAPSPIN